MARNNVQARLRRAKRKLRQIECDRLLAEAERAALKASAAVAKACPLEISSNYPESWIDSNGHPHFARIPRGVKVRPRIVFRRSRKQSAVCCTERLETGEWAQYAIKAPMQGPCFRLEEGAYEGGTKIRPMRAGVPKPERDLPRDPIGEIRPFHGFVWEQRGPLRKSQCNMPMLLTIDRFKPESDE